MSTVDLSQAGAIQVTEDDSGRAIVVLPSTVRFPSVGDAEASLDF